MGGSATARRRAAAARPQRWRQHPAAPARCSQARPARRQAGV